MKIAAVTPKIHLGDCEYNADRITEFAEKVRDRGCDLVVFPKLVLTGNTCGDILENADFKKATEAALEKIRKKTAGLKDLTIVFGAPFYKDCIDDKGKVEKEDKCTIIKDSFAQSGKTCESGIVLIINGELRYLNTEDEPIEIDGKKLFFTTDPTVRKNKKADIFVWMCALEYYAGCQSEYLNMLKNMSEETSSDVICVSAGEGESTDECIYSGIKAFVRDGEVTDYSFKKGLCVFDMEAKDKEPINFPAYEKTDGFLPSDDGAQELFCLDILKIQASALAQRLELLNVKKCIIGLSGGLDSTLALVATVNAFDRSGLDKKGIICVTMPGFGTGSRTKDNAYRLAKAFGVTLREIDIKEQTSLHLKSIGQPETGGEFLSDVTFENAQARVRTMILMDIANMEKSIVIGTGDMSELALGWCTYNGDHMSMYSVNSGVPKTAIAPVLRTYVNRVAQPGEREMLNEIFESIIGTPVSPELLPTDENGEVVQKTEDSLGPYELHDYFLYMFLKGDHTTKEICERCEEKFKGTYDKELILKTLNTFKDRFFTQQFKRSCLPVGAKVLKYSLSPRCGFLMASDMRVQCAKEVKR